MIFFTSDLHFNAQRTIDKSRRPFKSLEELNKTLIDNWNNTVSKDDTVYILGDFGDLSYAQFLNGKKIFVKGNYERGYYTDEELKQYFDVVCPVDVMHLPVSYNGEVYHFRLAHEPLKVSDRDVESDYMGLFGHIHKLCMVKSYGLNVGADCHYYTPISLETVLFYHNAILNYYDDDVFK